MQRETTSSDSYFREVTPEDKRDFKLAVWKDQDGEVQSKMRCYYNPKTQEISGQHPKDVLPYTRDGITFDELCTTVFKGAAIGFILSGTPILLGYSVITLSKGTLIGSAIGAIKAYVDSVQWKETLILISKCPNADIELIEGEVEEESYHSSSCLENLREIFRQRNRQ